MWRERIRSQPMFDILREVQALERSGSEIIHLEIGDTSGFINSELKRSITQAASEQEYGYSPSAGEYLLRQTIAEIFSRDLNITVPVEQVCIAPANALILQSLAAIAAEGDTVLIPDPGFPTYSLASNFLGLKIQPYSVFANGAPRIEPLRRIRDRLHGAKPVAIILNNPSNPLGHVFDWTEFSELFEFAVEVNATLVFDETYLNLTYGAAQVESPSDLGTDVVRMRSLSKEHAAPGLRIGYCHASTPIIETISNFSSMVYSCVPSFIQIGTARYLKSDESNRFVQNLKIEMSDRFSLLVRQFNEGGVELTSTPNAGFYAFLDVEDGDQMFRILLDQFGVAVCPGSAFGKQGKRAIRISLAGVRCDVEIGIGRIVTGISHSIG